MTEVEVRLASAGDLEEIVRLEREVETAPQWGYGVYWAMMEDRSRCLYVAWREGVRGFGVGRVAAGTGEVESLAVRQAEQGRGVGRSLLGAVMAWCVAAGAGEIELEVREGGVTARRLYESVGFVEVGRRVGYYTAPVETAVLMRWRGSEGAVSASND